MLFSTWPLQKITDAITQVEEILAGGQQSASSVQGSVSFSTPTEARRVLRDLYRAREFQITGKKPSSGIRIISTSPRGEY